MSDTYVWVVRGNIATEDNKREMVDILVCSSEAEANEENQYISGRNGIPSQYGGEIWKVRLGVYPLQEELVFGPRRRADGETVGTWGWVDFRDAPDENDPEYLEFKRLKEKFEPVPEVIDETP